VDVSERLGEEILAHDAEEEELTKSISDLTDACNLKRNAADGVLLRVAECCSTMCCVLQRVAVQRIAVCCSVLLCLAACYSQLQYAEAVSDLTNARKVKRNATGGAVYYSVFQRVAV